MTTRPFRTLCTAGLCIAFALGCGGAPIHVHIGEAPAPPPASPPAAAPTTAAPAAAVAPVAPAPTPRAPSGAPGQIQIVTGRGISPVVDGTAMTTTAEGYFLQVPAGRHTVSVYNLLGKHKHDATVHVRPGTRHVLGWDGRRISNTSTRPTAPIPAAFTTSGDVVITGLLVADASTVVTVDGRNAPRVDGGVHRLSGVAPGRRSVRIAAAGFQLYDGPIDVGMGGETRCDFVLGSGAWVPSCDHYP